MNLPTFDYERELSELGHKCIGGVDEVGRGAFAGPVVAACVVFASDFIHGVKSIETIINDSKKMSTKSRLTSDNWIRNNCKLYGLGGASVSEINQLGIKKASEMAMQRAVRTVQQKQTLEHLLVDAFYISNIRELPAEKQTPIIKGDSLSISIAAASIIAKVYRDNLMTNLSIEYPDYLWEKNKGYGTSEHRQIIKSLGPTKLHRYDFIKNWTYSSKL